MKKLIYPLAFAVAFYLQFIFYSCSDNSTQNVNNGDTTYNVWHVDNIDLTVAYTHPNANPNKPLGNNPIPNGLAPIAGQFQGIIKGQTTMTSIDVQTGSEFLYLSYSDPNSYKLFYLAYGAYNNNTGAIHEYDKIHVFGITEFPNMPANYRGVSYLINQFGMNLPPFCFINTGRLDSVMKVSGFSTDMRQKYITCVTAHEIAHCRGLADDNHGIADTTDDVHYGHTLDNQWCNMSNLASGGGDSIDLAHRYPPKLCCRHQKFVRDSMYDQNRNALSIPSAYGMNCN